jgi:hypothetical protein
MLWIGGPLACAYDFRPWIATGVIAVAVLLCVGVLTPLAALSGAVVTGTALLCSGNAQPVVTIASMTTASALALLGPGAYSVDAWMFGRRVLVVAPGKDGTDKTL